MARNLTKAEMLEVVKSFLPYMTEQWEFVDLPESTWLTTIQRGEFTVLIGSRHHSGTRGKLHIFGDYPDYKDKKINFSDNRWLLDVAKRSADMKTEPAVNISPDKDPRTIARDIERRFMPDYLKLHAAVLSTIASWQEDADTTESTFQRLSEALGIPFPDKEYQKDRSNRRAGPYDKRVDAYIRTGSNGLTKVDLTITYLTVDGAVAILSLLRTLPRVA